LSSSTWDEARWQPLCADCHAAKSAGEFAAWRRTGEGAAIGGIPGIPPITPEGTTKRGREGTTGSEQRRLLWLIATIIVAVAALAGCSNRDCAYYGGGDTNTRCVVVGPAPIGAGP